MVRTSGLMRFSATFSKSLKGYTGGDCNLVREIMTSLDRRKRACRVSPWVVESASVQGKVVEVEVEVEVESEWKTSVDDAFFERAWRRWTAQQV
jgi:hypothetical protein